MANEEEYHLPEDESVQTTTTTTTKSSSARGFQSNVMIKRIITIVVLLSLIWGAHRLYVALTKARKSKPAMQNITNLPQPTVFPARSSAQVSQVRVTTTTPAVTGFENRLANIEEGNADAQAKVERVNANLAELQNALAMMSSQITTLNNSIQDLTGQVNQQQAQIQSMTVAHERKAKKMRATTVNKKIFFIQAVIPGRVWLSSNNNEMLTVRVGDEVPGYGIVNMIDPVQGLVVTSSGQDIVFRNDES